MRQWLVSISILAFAVVGLMQAAEQPKSTMTVDRKKLRTAQANHTNDTKVLAEKTSASETTVKQVVARLPEIQRQQNSRMKGHLDGGKGSLL